MINPFNYLFYKIYKTLSCFSISGEPIGQVGVMTFLLGFNVLAIYFLIFKEVPSQKIGVTVFYLIATILFVAYRPKREAKIIAKFEKESEDSRLIGNIAVISYVIFSIWLCYYSIQSYRAANSIKLTIIH